MAAFKMRSFCNFVLFAILAVAICTTTLDAQGPTYRLGSTPTEAEIKAADTAIAPDGKGLPPGNGTAKEGAALFKQKCGFCHGADAAGGPGGSRSLIPLGNAKPVKLPISLVPYATTVWDFINRAMPQTRPGSLMPNEVYALTAYVLYRNDVIKEDEVLDATSLPKVLMPNRDNFLPERPEWKAGGKRPFGYDP
jgi:S-disulfanyl-L-cysteine oxidoreductase SoxD